MTIIEKPIEQVETSERKMPVQKPGFSKQTYGTPWEFIEVVERRFGKIVCDLAASDENAKCEKFFTEADNSLQQSWSEQFSEGTLWLNPPFKNIALWAKKCSEESLKRQGSILLLVPASISTNWFHEYVNKKAIVLAINPRLTFEGEMSSFPKDLMLVVYSCGLSGFDTWRWRCV